MKSTTKLENRPFDIFIPATERRPASKVTSITVQVRIDEDGDEVLTRESLELIDKTQARYMGLLTGEDIRALRQRLKLPQSELCELLGCGDKSWSRWENGRGHPSQLVNTMLRALDEGVLTVAQLRELQQPKKDWADGFFAAASLSAHFNINRTPAKSWMTCPALSRGESNMECLFGS